MSLLQEKTIFLSFIFSSLLTFQNMAEGKSSSFLPQSFKAEFSQEYISSLRNKTKTSKGRIDYRYPGHIRFMTEYPQKITFVSNPTQTWYYVAPFIQGEPGELTLNSGGKNNPYIQLFDLLGQNLKTNSYYKISRTKKSVILNFTSKGEKETQMKRAELLFSQGQEKFRFIKKIKITFKDQKTSTLKFSSLQTQVRFKKDHFIFKVPKNTRIY